MNPSEAELNLYIEAFLSKKVSNTEKAISDENLSNNSALDHSAMMDSASGNYRPRLISSESAAKAIGNISTYGCDYSILYRLLIRITLGRWRQTTVGQHTFSRSKIVDSITIEEPLSKALQVMHENLNHFSFIVIANQDKTMASASLSTRDLLKFMVTNYHGNMQVFNKPEHRFDYNHQ